MKQFKFVFLGSKLMNKTWNSYLACLCSMNTRISTWWWLLVIALCHALPIIMLVIACNTYCPTVFHHIQDVMTVHVIYHSDNVFYCSGTTALKWFSSRTNWFLNLFSAPFLTESQFSNRKAYNGMLHGLRCMAGRIICTDLHLLLSVDFLICSAVSWILLFYI